MPNWPEGLPTIAMERSFVESPPDLKIRTEMDSGIAKVRRRFTSGVRPMSFDIPMTLDQVEIFDQFYSQDLASGALSVDFPHPRTGNMVEIRILGVPQYVPRGGLNWLVKLSVEVLP